MEETLPLTLYEGHGARPDPDPLPEAVFVLGVHLGRLAELLRHVGIDALEEFVSEVRSAVR